MRDVLSGRCCFILLFVLCADLARATPSFERVRPVLVESCLNCHGGEKVKGGLNLATREGLLRGGENEPSVVPGKPEQSLLCRQLTHEEDPGMPWTMVSTVGSAMLGLTVACARCHDHKYDPISTRDYYRMAAAFTSTKRLGVSVRSDQKLDAGALKEALAQPMRVTDESASPADSFLCARGDPMRHKEPVTVGRGAFGAEPVMLVESPEINPWCKHQWAFRKRIP